MRALIKGLVVSALACGPAAAEDTIRIGVLLPISGTFTLIGQAIQTGFKAYMLENGDHVAGKKIELVVRDTQSVPDVARRVAQELVVNDKVAIISGIGTSPDALAIAPVATQSRLPMVVMGAGASMVTTLSPYIVRTSFTGAQVAAVAGAYFGAHGVKTAVTITSDYASGHDNEDWFSKKFEAAGAKVVEKLRPPLANPDFSPYLQKAADAHTDGVFMFVPTGQNGVLMRQFAERGMGKSGLKPMTVGDVVDETLIDQIGDVALGVESAFHYSDAHPSPENEQFVADFEKLSNGMRANMMAVGGYDGLQLIYKALDKTKGSAEVGVLLDAMKDMAWQSPRGPVRIDPETRDIIQNVYMRRVERRGARLVNVEFATYPEIKDPVKAEPAK